MNSNERKDVRKTASDNGYRQSSSDSRTMIDNHGNKIKEVGTNRTNINGNTVFGSTAAKNAINND